MSRTGYRHAGDIEIATINLITAGNQLIDVSELVVQLDIYQSIAEPFMRAEISIQDSVALLNSIAGGFTGGELLAVSWKSAEDSLEYLNHLFVLHEVSDRVKMNDNREIYLIHGSSIELYQNVGYHISRAYGTNGGQLISEMVKDIIDNYVYNSSAQKLYDVGRIANVDVIKTVEIDETSGNQKMVIPMLSPIESINMLAHEADNDIGVPYYVFFEDSQGFKFKDLRNLVSQDPIGQYVYQPKNFDDDSDFYKINSYSIDKQNSFYDNVTGGMLKNQNYQLDIMRRQWNVSEFNYSKSNSSLPKLQQVSALGQVGETSSPAIFYTTSRIGHDIDSRFSREGVTPSQKTNFMGKKVAAILNLNSTIVTVDIPGDSNINVGNVVLLRIPSSSNDLDQKEKDDGSLSGRYIVTSVRHMIEGSGDKFNTILECVKEAGIQEDEYQQSQASLPDVSGVLPMIDSGTNAFNYNNPTSALSSLGAESQTFNDVKSRVISEAARFAVNQALGDGGADTFYTQPATVNMNGNISNISDRMFSGATGFESQSDKLNKLGGNVDTKKVLNVEDAQKVVEISENKSTTSEVTLSDGNTYKAEYVPELKSTVLKRTV